MWRRAIITIMALTLLLPAVSAETESEFLFKVSDIADEGADVMSDVSDTIEDYADGWIGDSVFISRSNQYHSDFQYLESRAEALELPCERYKDVKKYLVNSMKYAKWAIEDVQDWYYTGDSSYLDSAILWMEFSSDASTNGAAEIASISLPACGTTGGDGNGEDSFPLWGMICGSIAVVLIIMAVLALYQGYQKAKQEEELRAEGLCVHCKGEGSLWSAKEGLSPCPVCGGTGKAEVATELTEEEKRKFDKYLEEKLEELDMES